MVPSRPIEGTLITSPRPELPPLSLYIHIPWCVRKCPYCDFNSHAKQDALPEQQYIDALLEDLNQDLGYVDNRPVHSIFIGGGTPSLFSAEAYAQLLSGIQQRLTFSRDIEITLEANPGTLEQGRFAAYRQLGINRLSIGVQSFHAQQLEKLGRIHNEQDALKAIHNARQAGFENFNIDLMHGLSGQTTEAALADLNTAIDAGAPHISWYQLTIEPNTEFYKRPPTLPVEREMNAIQSAGFALLESAGFEHYEVSAFARPGRQARHNLNYWQFGDYLALGAGAHGKISQWSDEGLLILRYQKTRKPEDYLQRSPSRTSKTQQIAGEDLALEFMMNALRLYSGFTRSLFEQRTDRHWDTIYPTINALIKKGLLLESSGHYKTSPRGMELLDSVLAEFLPA